MAITKKNFRIAENSVTALQMLSGFQGRVKNSRDREPRRAWRN
jgi:hypothetical protein